jgi:hypothetical protein
LGLRLAAASAAFSSGDLILFGETMTL